MRGPGVRVPSPALRFSGRGECLLEVGPELVDRLEPDREPEQAGRDAVAFPPVAALHRGANAAEAGRVHDHTGGRLDGARLGDVERDEAAEAWVADILDRRVRAQPARD